MYNDISVLIQKASHTSNKLKMWRSPKMQKEHKSLITAETFKTIEERKHWKAVLNNSKTSALKEPIKMHKTDVRWKEDCEW